MSSDAKNCVAFSVVKLEPHKHVLKPGGLGWFRKICCLRDNCGETGRVRYVKTPLGSVKTGGKQYNT